MPSSHLILCCPLLLLPPIPPSIRVLLYTKEINNKDVLHSAGNYIQEIEKEYMYVYVCTFVVVQSLSHVRFFATLWTAACQASLSFTISRNLLKLMSIESLMPSNHLIPCHPFSFCPQSFPASGSFLMIWLSVSGGQSIGTSASASVLLINIQDSFPLGLTGLISLQSKGLSRVFSCSTVQRYQFFGTKPSLWSNFHIHT